MRRGEGGPTTTTMTSAGLENYSEKRGEENSFVEGTNRSSSKSKFFFSWKSVGAWHFRSRFLVVWQCCVLLRKAVELRLVDRFGIAAEPSGRNLKDLDLEVVTQLRVWNLRFSHCQTLCTHGHIQLFQQGGTLIYKEANRDDIAKFKGLSSEDMLVFQAIQQSASSGIWTMDLKRRTNLQQPQVTKAIKILETRNLIKAVKSVEHKSRKVYMLFELEPSRDVTGGAFYTEQEFDVEFISVLKHQCLHFILKQGLATLENVADSVRKSGITKEELRLQDFKQIIDMLVLDGEIEEEISNGIRAHVAFPLVLRDCTEDGIISPKTCVYYQQWLSF